MSESPLHKLIEWYRKHVKPFFLDHGLEKVEEYDAEIKRLERIQATLQAKLPACFLGNAGIGKSTSSTPSFSAKTFTFPPAALVHSPRRR